MQTGFQSFNLQILGTASESRSCAGACGQKAQDPTSDSLSDFMEIMSALMALPPEQWQDSLSELETGLSDDPSSLSGDKSDLDQLGTQQFDLMGFFLNLQNAVQKELEEAQNPDKANALLDIAKAIMNDREMLGAVADESTLEDLKTKWLQLYNQNLPSGPAGTAQQTEAMDMSAVVQSAQNPIPEAEVIEALKNPGIQSEALSLPAETEQAAVDTSAELSTTLEELAKKLSQKHPQAKADASPSGAHRTQAPASQVNALKGQPMDLDPANPPAVEQSTHEPLLSDSESEVGFSDLQGPAAAKPDNLETQGLLKPSGLNGTPQEVLSRLEAKGDQSAVHDVGLKELMPQDKALQSDVIRQIVQRMSMHTQGGQSKMVIHLKPEYLGNVHMQVLTENHQVTVRMMADSMHVKEMVEQNIQHLRTELQHHGLEIQKFDVFVASDNESWQNGREQAGFKEFQRQKKQRLDSGSVKLRSAKTTVATGARQTINQKDLNEIDYFA